MIQEVEISSFDLRYESYRMRNEGVERKLLHSIMEQGVCDPVEGVDAADEYKILLNGFKRYRCSKKLGIGIIPYLSLGKDETMGIIQLIRVSNSKSLSILEQAKLIDDLKNVHNMAVSEIAGKLERSKSWVSMRLGLLDEMSEYVRERIFNGSLPVYSYMYTLRQFRRMNLATQEEIDEFVKVISKNKLSIRDIEILSHGYFKGSADFRNQIKTGHIVWALKQMRELEHEQVNLNEAERGMLRELEIVQKYMQKVIYRCKDSKLKGSSFFAQANLLSGGILSRLNIFSRSLKDFYDRSTNA
jgi:ParB/RepB/Spo0J family partition protein